MNNILNETFCSEVEEQIGISNKQKHPQNRKCHVNKTIKLKNIRKYLRNIQLKLNRFKTKQLIPDFKELNKIKSIIIEIKNNNSAILPKVTDLSINRKLLLIDQISNSLKCKSNNEKCTKNACKMEISSNEYKNKNSDKNPNSIKKRGRKRKILHEISNEINDVFEKLKISRTQHPINKTDFNSKCELKILSKAGPSNLTMHSQSNNNLKYEKKLMYEFISQPITSNYFDIAKINNDENLDLNLLTNEHEFLDENNLKWIKTIDTKFSPVSQNSVSESSDKSINEIYELTKQHCKKLAKILELNENFLIDKIKLVLSDINDQSSDDISCVSPSQSPIDYKSLRIKNMEEVKLKNELDSFEEFCASFFDDDLLN